MITTRLKEFIPGVALCFFIGFIATFLGSYYGAPQMLFALLLGMALSFLSKTLTYQPGIEISSKSILRIGVALLGFRFSLKILPHLAMTSCFGSVGASYYPCRLVYCSPAHLGVPERSASSAVAQLVFAVHLPRLLFPAYSQTTERQKKRRL